MICYAQVTRSSLTFAIDLIKHLKHQSIKSLDKMIKRACDDSYPLPFPKFSLESLKILGYSDASFAGNFDLLSQLVRIFLLVDDKGTEIPVTYISHKSRGFLALYSPPRLSYFQIFILTQCSLMEQDLDRCVPLHLLTDSKSLFDIISKGSRANEKRLMLDIYAARERYHANEISNIGFVRSEHNMADSLTNEHKQASLLAIMHFYSHSIEVEQWILRPS